MAECTLHQLVKIEDWFKDQSTIVRTVRKGKGRNPFTDSEVKMRLEIKVNDEVILSNFPKIDPATGADWDLFKSENLRGLTSDQKQAYLKDIDNTLFKLRLDSYELPSLIIKVIKTMKKNGVTTISTTRIDKLRTNFKSETLGID